MPWNVRVWAFDTLQAAAAQYNTNNNPSAIPTQIHTWALWVSSGAVERPKRPRGRDRDKNLARDRGVACSIAWLRQYQGYTYEAAIELVAESTGLTVEAVKSILEKERDSGRPSPSETVKKASHKSRPPARHPAPKRSIARLSALCLTSSLGLWFRYPDGVWQVPSSRT